MPVLDNIKHEEFALLVVKGVSATKAYTSVGYSPMGAQQSAARLLSNAMVCSRVRELQETVSSATIALEISSRNSRVMALQKRWDRLRASLETVLDERGRDMVDVPGGSSGILCRDYKGKEADKEVTRIDPGVVALVAEIRGHERQAAEELEQWKTHHEEHKTIDATPAAIALAMVMSTAELEELAARMKAAREAGEPAA